MLYGALAQGSASKGHGPNPAGCLLLSGPCAKKGFTFSNFKWLNKIKRRPIFYDI